MEGQSSPECVVRPQPHLLSLPPTLPCRDFPRDGYFPAVHVLPRLTVTIPERPHSSRSMGFCLGTPQPLLLPVGVSGIYAFIPFSRLISVQSQSLLMPADVQGL